MLCRHDEATLLLPTSVIINLWIKFNLYLFIYIIYLYLFILIYIYNPQVALNLDHSSACFARAFIYLIRSNFGFKLHVISSLTFFLPWLNSPWLARASPLTILHNHTHTHTHTTRWDSSGQVIDLLQRPVPDNTQHSQEKDMQASGGIRTRCCSKWAVGIGIDDNWKGVFHMVNILLSWFLIISN
jgi:hypothetical protein